MTLHMLRVLEVMAAVWIAVGTLELLALRRAMADDGIWRFATLAPELGWLRAVLAYRPFLALLAVRLAAALLLVAGVHGPVSLVLWLTTLLVNVRFRGTFNGGSDLMTMVVLTGLVVAHLGHRSALLVNGALLYIAAQVLLSYFVAGVVKLANPAWRNGTALRDILARADFAVPAAVRRPVAHPAVAVVVSWVVIVFELAFPAAFTSVPAAVAFAVVVGIFHLANVAAFGLNRFLLAWASAWPAVIWAARVL